MVEQEKTGILLTEADCFMYTLEKHLIRQPDGSTNVCRYLLELGNTIDAEEFARYINSIPELQWLASLHVVKKHWVALPAWEQQTGLKEIPVHVQYSDELLPEKILEQKMKLNGPQLKFDLVYRSGGGTGLIFSWHHLIMDGYGAALLLKQLAARNQVIHSVIDSNPKKIQGIAAIMKAARGKFFVDRISRKPLSSIAPIKELPNRSQKIRTICLSEKETERLDAMGVATGAHFGRSPLYLAASARSVCQVLQNRGVKVNDFWVPVPKDLRRKGADGPLLGNHTSFLFYRMKSNELGSFTQTVQSINAQMVEQVKSGISRDYDILMQLLRRTPTPLYYFWIKGPQGGSLASFLFTVAADHPDDFTFFQNIQIKDAWSFPPFIYPPGLGLAFMMFKKNLHIMINYFEGVVSNDELDLMEMSIKKDLLSNG